MDGTYVMIARYVYLASDAVYCEMERITEVVSTVDATIAVAASSPGVYNDFGATATYEIQGNQITSVGTCGGFGVKVETFTVNGDIVHYYDNVNNLEWVFQRLP